MIIAETERLILKTWDESDFDDAYSLWSDEEVTKYISSKPFSRDEVTEHLEQLSQCQKEHGFQYWALKLKTESCVIGCCGLKPWIFAEEKRDVEIGFHIAKKFWRQGFAKEAAEKVIDYAFEELHLSQLYAGHHPSNEASRNLLLKLGFTKFKDSFFPMTGKIHPTYFLEKMRSDSLL